MRYKSENFSVEAITKKIIRSVGARRYVDPNMSESFRIPFINELYNTLVYVVRQHPFDNG